MLAVSRTSGTVGELDEGAKCAAKVDNRFMADDMMGGVAMVSLYLGN
jgi:hypothetical protein